MHYASHRRAEGRNFDCIYDPNFIVPSEKEITEANESALQKSATLQIQPKYNAMFENAPKSKRKVYRKQLNDLPNNGNNSNGKRSPNSSEVDAQSVQRLKGGANNPAVRKVTDIVYSPSECKKVPPGLHNCKPNTNVNVINVKLSDSKTNQDISKIKQQKYAYCQYFGDQITKRKCIKTRGTQTLYRESSAQTLPYLPDVSNKENELDRLELFKLPTVLPGTQPPGLHEVEVLERSRKRWAFSKALKENFKRQLEEAREHIKFSKHKHILEAFEWEYWIEREEYIQECQMMRLDLLIQMFDKREKEIHKASKTRIQMSYDRISADREAALRKNEIVYQRQIRLLNMKKAKVPRNWRKENIVSQFGSPSSEYYGPQKRYGVNPNRRHFKGQKAFEERMDDLEKRAVNMKKLVCPFAKLKEWSKPKGRIREVEQNFCAEENLKKMYESLTGLRKQSTKQRTVPKCLLGKMPQQAYAEHMVEEEISVEAEKAIIADVIKKDVVSSRGRHPLNADRKSQKERLLQQLHENDNEELEGMLNDYEGSTVGWLMRFLSEEMSRLQEQRVLHFITMLAQKERWRREAAEAGLRQKENEMREIYEQFYDETSDGDTGISKEYLENILSVDTREYADDHANYSITSLAKTIDKDIQRWLDSFKDIQNPLNFDKLRYTLKDIIFPDLEKILKQNDNVAVSKYIIDSVLFPKVYKKLESYDVSFTIANETVDRLIDTDLCTISPDCSECFCTVCECSTSKIEAKSILRKAIRYAVPGRRWQTPTERIAYENALDIVEDALREIEGRGSIRESHDTYNLCKLKSSPSHFDFFNSAISFNDTLLSLKKSEYLQGSQFISSQRFDCTKTLAREEKLLIDDQLDESQSTEIGTSNDDFVYSSNSDTQPQELNAIASAFDILSKAEDFNYSGSNIITSSSTLSDIGVDFGAVDGEKGNREAEAKSARRLLHVLIKDIVGNFVPAEPGDSETSTECQESLEECVSVEEEEDENDAKVILKAVLKDVLQYIPEDFEEEGLSYEYDGTSFEQMEELESEEMLLVSESEIEALEIDRCKCEAEIMREKYIRQMLDEGQVKIVPKAKKMVCEKLVEAEEQETNIEAEILDTVMAFEYASLQTTQITVPDTESVEIKQNVKTPSKLHEHTEALHPATIKIPFKLDVECDVKMCQELMDVEEIEEEMDKEFKESMSSSNSSLASDDFQRYIREHTKKQKLVDETERLEREKKERELENAALTLHTTDVIDQIPSSLTAKDDMGTQLDQEIPISEQSETAEQVETVQQAESAQQDEPVQHAESVEVKENLQPVETVEEAASAAIEPAEPEQEAANDGELL